jgi:hypothetical protein
VPLAAGHHQLRIEYTPVSFRVGLAVSAAAWLLWLWVAAGRPQPAKRMKGKPHGPVSE